LYFETYNQKYKIYISDFTYKVHSKFCKSKQEHFVFSALHGAHNAVAISRLSILKVIVGEYIILIIKIIIIIIISVTDINKILFLLLNLLSHMKFRG